MQTIEIYLNNFPTHVKLAEKGKKSGKARYIKISTQSIYNGKMQTFTRAKVIKVLKECIRKAIADSHSIPKSIKGDINLSMELHSPLRFPENRMMNDILTYPIEGTPKWDVDNFSYIWIKAFQDTLTDIKLIPDDSVNYIKSTGKATFVEDEDIYIKFIIETNESNKGQQKRKEDGHKMGATSMGKEESKPGMGRLF